MIREFFKYAMPSALAMFISSLYTIIDGIFVGQGVGDSALAAVNVVLPFTIMLFGMATMFAVGGGALVSKNFGAGNKEKAINTFRQVTKFVLIATVGISLVCIIFTPTIVRLLGATDNLVGLSTEYLRYYAFFCVPNLIGIVLNSFVRNDGQPKLAMISTISGALTNIVLDYIFIFPLVLGIKGAAIATGLGQIVTVAIVLPHFFKKNGELSLGKAKINYINIKEVVSIGFPSFLAEVTFSIIILIQNIVLSRVIGEIGLSSYSIINYVTTNIYMVLLGLTFGVQPLVSYNYGSKDSKKMHTYYKICMITSIIINIIFTLVCFIWGRELIEIFSSDIKIINMTYIGLNITNLSFFMVGLNLTTTVYYQAIETPKLSNLICAFRSVVFMPISLLILSKIAGLNGIWAAMLISEIASFITITLITNIKKETMKAISIENCENNTDVLENYI